MKKIGEMGLVVTKGQLGEGFLEDYSEVECDPEAADALQQAFYGGAAAAIQAMQDVAVSEDGNMAKVLQLVAQLVGEFERFNELRDRALSSGGGSGSVQ